MRLRKFRARNLGPFADFVVDLEALPEDARLVAVTGPNGAGKSTFLELFTGGALYRKCETRGSLTDLATARDAELDVAFVNGASWTVRHSADAVSGKGESVVLGDDGSPAYASTKIRDFAAWSADNLPPPEILYSSLVAVQGAGGFLDAKPGERKAILLRSLGTERLEGLAADARERSRTAQTTVDTLAARIADERARCGDVDDILNELASAQHSAAVTAQELVAAQAELEATREAKAKAEAEQDAYLRAIGERGRLGYEIQETEGRLADVERRIVNNRSVLAEGDTIRGAVERIGELEAQAAQARQEATTAEHEAKSAWSTVSTHEDAMAGALAWVATAQDRAKRAQERASELDTVRAAAARVPELRRAYDEAARSRDAAIARLDEARGRRLAGAEERIGGLRGGLEDIRDGRYGAASTAADRAAMALGDDDERVRLAEETTRLIKDTDALWWRETASDRDAELRRAESTAARLPDVETAGADLETAAADERTAAHEAKEQRELAQEATARAEDLTAQARASQTRAKDLLGEADGLRPIAAKLKHLDQAEAKLEVYAPQAAELRATVARLQAELDAAPEPTRPSEPPSVASSAAILREAEGHHLAALAVVTRAEEAHQRAMKSVERIAELDQELAAAGAELADWTRLGKDLGRDGLQAALIDSACGELTAIANDLLHEAFGSRWTVSFETQRSDAKGKRTLEGMIVRVIDTERGRDAPAETYSGGEKTILGEAVSLALSTLACRRSGVDRPTLVRDESGAALDADKAVAYVAMLRRAAEMIGADRVLLVSHAEEVQQLCDARIEL